MTVGELIYELESFLSEDRKRRYKQCVFIMMVMTFMIIQSILSIIEMEKLFYNLMKQITAIGILLHLMYYIV